MITRLQSATVTTDTDQAIVVLPDPVTAGSALILFVGQTTILQPLVAAVTQTNANWSLVLSSVGLAQVGGEFWLALDVPSNASQTITVDLSLAGNAVVTVVEYSDVVKASAVDQTINNDGNSNSLYTGITAATTAAAEMWVAGITHLGGNLPQSLPSDGFTEVVQDTTDPLGDTTDVVAAFYERYVLAIGTAHMAANTAFAVDYVALLITLFEDLSTAYQRLVGLNAWIAAPAPVIMTNLNLPVAEAQSDAIGLNVYVRPDVQTELDVAVVTPTSLLAGLDVLRESAREVLLNVYMVGDNEQRSVLLQPFIAFVPQRITGLDVTIRGLLEPRRVKLDVSILNQPTPTNVTTTPEGSRYLACRPLWCQVPKQHTVWARYDVNVGGYGSPETLLEVLVQDGQTVLTGLQVFIAPEP
jgi:hypothetical protein